VASEGDCGCGVVDVGCNVVGMVVVMYMVWSGGFGNGGGWMGVGIGAGVCFGGYDVGCGGGCVCVVMCEVVCGGGVCVVVFYLHSLRSSISLAPLRLTIFLVGS
jgi:hypothetical protein